MSFLKPTIAIYALIGAVGNVFPGVKQLVCALCYLKAVTAVPEPVNISNGVGQAHNRNSGVATEDVHSGSVGRIRACRGRKPRRSLRSRGTSRSTTSSSSSTSASVSASVGCSTRRRSLRSCHTPEAPRRSSRRRLCRLQEQEEEEQVSRLRPRRIAAAAVRHYYEVDEEDDEEEGSSQNDEDIVEEEEE